MLDALVAAVDEVVATDPPALGTPDAMVELLRQRTRLDAAIARAGAAFDSSKAWQASGARSAKAWLTATTRLAKPEVGRCLTRGRAMRNLPVASREWLAGTITGEHVRVLASVRNDVTAELLARDEQMLVGHAKTMTFAHFERTVEYWHQHADPDGVEEDSDRQLRLRDAWFVQGLGGEWLGKQRLDPIGGTIVGNEWSRLTDAMFHADWKAAKDRLGREPFDHELGRTPAQRRADAMVEMARRSARPDGPADPRPLFTVLVGYETLHGRICELANGRAVTPGSLLPWLSQAQIERVVFDAKDRVINVGVRRRLFRGATRRAVEVRDRECFQEFCDMPADRCQVDHIIPWPAGGPTTTDNGRLACGVHNRTRHKHPSLQPEDRDEDDVGWDP